MSRQQDLYESRAKLEAAYREFTRRKVSNIVVYAGRFIFEELLASLQCMETVRQCNDAALLQPQEPRVPNFVYKTATVFRVERDDYALVFHGNIEETYR
jgi:hypothetical protein